MVEHVVVHDRSGWHCAWRFTRIGLFVLLILLIIAVAVVWIGRKPIADDYIRDELERRGVTATYKLDRVGFRTQQVSNLVIGDPSNPDLSVRHATIQLKVQVERQRQSLSGRGAGRAAEGPGGREQGQLGPGRQAAARRRPESRSRSPT